MNSGYMSRRCFVTIIFRPNRSWRGGGGRGEGGREEGEGGETIQQTHWLCLNNASGCLHACAKMYPWAIFAVSFSDFNPVIMSV